MNVDVRSKHRCTIIPKLWFPTSISKQSFSIPLMFTYLHLLSFDTLPKNRGGRGLALGPIIPAHANQAGITPNIPALTRLPRGGGTFYLAISTKDHLSTRDFRGATLSSICVTAHIASTTSLHSQSSRGHF